MADPQQILEAMRKADAAGDTAGAKRLAELYRDASSAPTAEPHQSLGDRVLGVSNDIAQNLQDFTGKFGRPAMQTAGGIAGGVLAAPGALAAGIPSGGAGAAAVEAGGVGAGSALGGHYYDNARDYFTGSKSPPLSQQALTAAQDFSAGASVVPGGKLAGGAFAKAAPIVASAPQRLAGLLDAGATPAAESVRAAALSKALAQQKAGVNAGVQAGNLKAADAGLRANMEKVASDQAAQGISVSDTPEAQQLVAALRAKQSPNGPVAMIPTKDQNAVYQQIIDTLAPPSGPKPDLETIDNLRRLIAKPAYGGELQGAAAIDKIERRNLVRALSGVEDAYTSGASKPVRENWAQAMDFAKQAKAAEKLAPELQVAVAKLETLSPADSATTARGIVEKLAKKNLISDDEHREFLQLAEAATTAQGKAAFRRRMALGAGTLAGLGAVTGHAIHLLP